MPNYDILIHVSFDFLFPSFQLLVTRDKEWRWILGLILFPSLKQNIWLVLQSFLVVAILWSRNLCGCWWWEVLLDNTKVFIAVWEGLTHGSSWQGGQPNLKTKFQEYSIFINFPGVLLVLLAKVHSIFYCTQAKQYVHWRNVVGKVKSIIVI